MIFVFVLSPHGPDSTPSTRVIKMAKSIRSKHRRKMRNVKREHFAKKGLESLKKMAAADAASLQEVVTSEYMYNVLRFCFEWDIQFLHLLLNE